ncbi:hypothetical protein GJ496_002242 [Pomphorhynchus laevis]|nr:hypothetical protein GJ496_002242 [Pomphorhynchus laevis]
MTSPLDCCIDKFFLLEITGQTQIKDFQREIIALPTRFGGLGIGNPSSLCAAEWNFSVAMCSPLEAGLTGIDLEYAQNEIRTNKDLERVNQIKRAVDAVLDRCDVLTRQAIFQSQSE